MNSAPSVFFYDRATDVVDHTSEVLEGFRRKAKFISPKFFYDERGSQLFTEITHQPEYYLTRTETALLQEHAGEISDLIGEDILLIEFGSGSSTKIRILLENLRPSIYAPLDISRDYLAQAAQALGSEYPWLEVHATCVDFTGDFELPFRSEQRHVSFFPGSSIGNFERTEAEVFLKRVRQLVGEGGGLLLGVDLKKDETVLNAAYNDRAGITRDFNLNVLSHLNREYGTDFNEAAFDHLARYNPDEGCIEMFLVSRVEQTVTLANESFRLEEGEVIHTENSHKYAVDEVRQMALNAGFGSIRIWSDQDELFAVFYLS
ncbi:MAG: L-histidine N(alpha)-methyltransferase [Gammaproteobacteria bacterium]|jgi:dimethylhistidine N-methyltransferase|nr:L-histidine N(alpha)-methyltransferase [Gammaproteobacteria bacterium]MBT4494628.1 L-histidine N(alpha)-methyltransferase [Gammaproteobacteria bacterium]MBT7369753.1 L-histidine N(alpha)-methyltransferase [Gammaproteobacteria bacterium]